MRITLGMRSRGGLAMAILITTAMLFSTTGIAGATVAPATLSGVVQAGQPVTEQKVVSVPEIPPKVDVIFAFDLTGSMSGTIGAAKAEAASIMASLTAETGADFNFGVMSYMDYPNAYDSYGYSSTYGLAITGDYAYSLDQAVTSNTAAVSAAINGLALGSGGDGPQDYARIMFESYSDTNVAWRADSRKVLVNFGDNVPHDNDLNEDVYALPAWSTGGDPGRNGVMDLGGDDIDLQTALAGMIANDVTLIECHTADWPASWMGGPVGHNISEYWTAWTAATGGGYFLTSDASFLDNVVDAIVSTLSAQDVEGLHLDVCDPSYASWLAVAPASQTGPSGTDYNFDVTITPPAGTAPGVYEFQICAVDDDHIAYGTQDVMIVVYDPNGGFVTGGGWIDSPAGAYAVDPELAGKATFGFVSKYQKGATAPTGNTTFVFHAAGMTFNSTSYQWLTIAGPKAQYKGVGTIDGAGTYGFMLTATDGQVTGGGGVDRLRMKIWDPTTGEIVYDNSTEQALMGGSILIHKK